jgi:hypothetical protein
MNESSIHTERGDRINYHGQRQDMDKDGLSRSNSQGRSLISFLCVHAGEQQTSALADGEEEKREEKDFLPSPS